MIKLNNVDGDVGEGVGQVKKNFGVKFHSVAILMISTVMSAALLVGQVGCNQDPLANKSDEIRNGQLPGLKPTPGPTPENSDALKIDAKTFFVFREGVPGEEQLSGRVLGAIDGEEPVVGRDFVFHITNLDDFKGQTSFDPNTGLFKWTPAKDTSSTDYSKSVTMNVTMETIRGKIRKTTTSINVFVIRDEGDPTVVRVDDLRAAPVREGTIREFKVVVKDPDADATSSGLPKLMIVSAGQNMINVSGLISQTAPPTRDPSANDQWIFVMRLDTRTAELTTSSAAAQFGLMAVGRFGHSSAPYTVDVAVRTEIASPVFSWTATSWDAVEFKTNQTNSISFTVSDPKGEGTVHFTFANLPSGAQGSCKPSQTDASVQLCTLTWKIDRSGSTGDFTVTGTATNDSPISGDPSKTTACSRIVRVVQGPVDVLPEATPPTPAETAPSTPAAVASPTPSSRHHHSGRGH